MTPTVLLGALGFGIVVSVIFALYPAWRASKLKPVDALRYEWKTMTVGEQISHLSD